MMNSRRKSPLLCLSAQVRLCRFRALHPQSLRSRQRSLLSPPRPKSGLFMQLSSPSLHMHWSGKHCREPVASPGLCKCLALTIDYTEHQQCWRNETSWSGVRALQIQRTRPLKYNRTGIYIFFLVLDFKAEERLDLS